VNEPSTVQAITVEVNGTSHERVVQARQLLVHFLRETMELQGTHIGCDTGNCGACTVLVDGQPQKSCMVLAVQADGRSITTVEGLAAPADELTPLQRSFNEHHAVQCGYCTPGMLIQATALLQRDPTPDEDTIRHALKGNLCRCTGYVNIVRAVQAASGQEVRT